MLYQNLEIVNCAFKKIQTDNHNFFLESPM